MTTLAAHLADSLASRETDVQVLDRLARECYETAKKSGFHDAPDDGSLERNLMRIALAHSELSEALEELRRMDTNADDVAEELADAVIRIFDLAVAANLRIGKAIIDKMDKNKTRPYKHGKRI